jgi:hypothetical protein
MTSHPGYGAVPSNPTYSNVTITSTGATTAPIYTTGTGIGYNPVEATWSAGATKGTMHATDLILDGVSLKQLLEERLNMMVPNPELEKEWHELKKLGDQYRKLETDLKEKAKMWKALNKV